MWQNQLKCASIGFGFTDTITWVLLEQFSKYTFWDSLKVGNQILKVLAVIIVVIYICLFMYKGHGTYTAVTVISVPLSKVGRKSIDFPSHFWWPWPDLPDIIKFISQNLNVYIFLLHWSQSVQDNWLKTLLCTFFTTDCTHLHPYFKNFSGVTPLTSITSEGVYWEGQFLSHITPPPLAHVHCHTFSDILWPLFMYVVFFCFW